MQASTQNNVWHAGSLIFVGELISQGCGDDEQTHNGFFVTKTRAKSVRISVDSQHLLAFSAFSGLVRAVLLLCEPSHSQALEISHSLVLNASRVVTCMLMTERREGRRRLHSLVLPHPEFGPVHCFPFCSEAFLARALRSGSLKMP